MGSSTSPRPDLASRTRPVPLPPGGFELGGLNAHYEGAYDDRALEWRRLGARDKAENIRHLLSLQGAAPGSILEVGCGTGAVLATLAEAGVGSRHVGVDLADPGPHADPLCAKHAVELSAFDGVTLPFADRSFDLVVASHVVEHVEHPRQFLRELSRVASRLLYLEIPCEMNLSARRSGLIRSLAIGHINHYTPDSFVVLVNSAGLRVEEAILFDHSDEVLGFGRSPMSARALKLARRGALGLLRHQAARLFTYHFGVLARSEEISRAI